MFQNLKKKIILFHFKIEPRAELKINKKSPARGADGHRRQRAQLVAAYTCNHNDKLLAVGSAVIKLSGFR